MIFNSSFFSSIINDIRLVIMAEEAERDDGEARIEAAEVLGEYEPLLPTALEPPIYKTISVGIRST